jgi:hypothetical protein
MRRPRVFVCRRKPVPTAGRGSKFERAITSEIVATEIAVGKATSSRIDPLGIEKVVQIYEKPDGDWTLDPEDAPKSNPMRPSKINHGNIRPSIHPDVGGVTAGAIDATTVLSLIQLRRLRFPMDVDGDPFERGAKRRHLTPRATLAALPNPDGRGRRSAWWCRSLPVPHSGLPKEGALTRIGGCRAASSSEPPASVGLACASRSLATASSEAIHHTTASTTTRGHRHDTIEKQPSEPWPGMCNARARHTSSNGESGSVWRSNYVSSFGSGDDRHILVGFWRLRQRSVRRQVPLRRCFAGDRVSRGGPRLRP